MDNRTRIPPDRLLDFAAAVYARAGMPEADARLAADTLVQADSGATSRTRDAPVLVCRAPSGRRVRAGGEAGAGGGRRRGAVLDGHDGMGQVLTARAMEEAIRRAKAHGVGAVALRNSNHFGTAMYFTLMAARAGCVGFLSTNASPAMAPWGGRQKTAGTSPWSWAAPAGRHPPMVLDIANTGVARGKVYLAKQKGLPIPEGWAIDAEGAPTTDPARAIEGVILPMAGHKGYAIAVVMDVLSGVLTGSAFGTGVHGPYQAEHRGGAGQFMVALDIAAFQPLAEFEARMEALIAELKSVPLAQGFEEVVYPGELEARNDARNRREGLELPEDTLADLRKLARETGLEARLPF